MVANEGTSRRRIVKYMPLKDNRRARQNQVKQSSHFVDSDFFDSQSVQRVTQPPSFPHRMRSTSPVSSRASTMLRQQSLRTRKSQMESPPPKGSGQVVTTQTSNKPSLREDSDMSKYEKMMMLKRKQKAYSIERQLLKQEERTEKMIQQNENRSLSRMYQKKFIERREKQVQIINKQIYDTSD